MVKVLFRRPCHVPPCLINGEGGSKTVLNTRNIFHLLANYNQIRFYLGAIRNFSIGLALRAPLERR